MNKQNVMRKVMRKVSNSIVPVIIFAFVITILVSIILCYDGSTKDPEGVTNKKNRIVVDITGDNMSPVENHPNLFYDKDTLVVYYIFLYGVYSENRSVCMSPYLHPSGRPYLYNELIDSSKEE